MPLSSHHIKGTFCQHDLTLLMFSLIQWIEVELVRFLHCKVIFSPFLYCTLKKKICAAHLRSRELCCTSLRAKYLCKLFRTFLCGRFILFPVYLSQYELIFFNDMSNKPVLVYMFYCSDFQLWPLGALPVDSCIFLTYLLHCMRVIHPCMHVYMHFTFGITRFSMLILYIFCPSHRISHFSKESWLLLLEKPCSGC